MAHSFVDNANAVRNRLIIRISEWIVQMRTLYIPWLTHNITYRWKQSYYELMLYDSPFERKFVLLIEGFT